MSRYSPLPSHQYDITKLSSPQVALHLAEGDISMGQSGKHALLRTRALLHWHTWGQRGTTVRRPAPTQWHTDKDKHPTNTHGQRQKEKETETFSGFIGEQRDRCVKRATPAVLSHLMYPLCIIPSHVFALFFTFQQGYCMSPEADKRSLMVQLLGVNGQINLALFKENLPIK